MTGIKWAAMALASAAGAAFCVDRFPGQAMIGARAGMQESAASAESREASLKSLLEEDGQRSASAADDTSTRTLQEEASASNIDADAAREENGLLADDLRDAAGGRRDDPGLWLAVGSFALMSFMVYRWISEDERPPTFDG